MTLPRQLTENDYLYKLYLNPQPCPSESIPILAYDFGNDGHVDFSIVMPSHNSVTALKSSVPALFESTTGVYEVIFVLDDCWDSSERFLRDFLKENFDLTGCTRVRVIKQPPPGIFETSAENLGMRLCSPKKAYISVQSDQIIIEKSWNEKMFLPIEQYPEKIFSVSAKGAHDVMKTWTNVIGIHKNFESDVDSQIDYFRTGINNRDVFTIRNSSDRGPLVFHADKMQRLGFFNEVHCFLGNDDHEIHARAKIEGWVTGYYPIGVISPSIWGASRRNWSLRDSQTERNRVYRLERQCRLEACFDKGGYPLLVSRPMSISSDELISETCLIAEGVARY